MTHDSSLHTLTHLVINNLQKAYITSLDSQAEGLILSALVTAKEVHDRLLHSDNSCADIDPEEYCTAI
jgi:hypothetical protein